MTHEPQTLPEPATTLTAIPLDDLAANTPHATHGVPAVNMPRAEAEIDPVDHLDFVKKVAMRMARRLPDHVSLDDLIGAGTLGLMEALDRFDPSKGKAFRTFAEFRIKGAILDELRRYDIMARNARLTAKRISRTMDELIARLGRPPTEEEIAATLDMSIPDYRKTVARVGNVRVLSLNGLSSPDPERGRGLQLAATQAGPEEVATMNEMHDHLRAAISNLPERHQLILEMYYEQELTLKEIGGHVGVTESRICQIVGDATNKLKAMLERKRERQAA